jgi:hypothetical protein
MCLLARHIVCLIYELRSTFIYVVQFFRSDSEPDDVALIEVMEPDNGGVQTGRLFLLVPPSCSKMGLFVLFSRNILTIQD